MKVIKAFIILIVLIVVVVVAGVGAFIAFVDADDIKSALVTKMREATGRELSLDGPIEWGVWPKLRVEAGPLTVGNAPGFGDEPFLAAQKIKVAVATLPLLSKRAEIDTVVLHGVQLNLVRNADGTSNWDSFAGATSGAHADERASGGMVALIVGGLDIQNARMSLRDDSTGKQVLLDKITATTGALTFGQPVELALSAVATANKPALDADLNLNGTLNYDTDADRYRLEPLTFLTTLRGKHLPGGSAKIEAQAALDVDLANQVARVTGLKLNGLGTRVEGEFSASELDEEKPSSKGLLSITGDDLALLFNAFALPVGKQLAGVANRKFSFVSAFDADMRTGEVAVSKLNGSVLGAKLSGGFTASKANTDEPVAKGNIDAAGPDLPSLIAVLGQLQGASAGTLKNLNQALAGSRDKSFTLVADLDVDMGEGRAALPKLDAKLLGNSVTGSITASRADTDKPAIKGALKASGPDFPALLAVASGLQADGKGLAAMAKSLAAEADKSFTLDANFDADLASGRLALPALAADLIGLQVRGTLSGDGVDFAQNKGTLDGKLSIASQNLGPLLRALDQGDMAQAVKGLKLDAGIKGSLADLTIAPLAVSSTIANAQVGKPVELKLAAGSARANLDAETLSLTALTVTGLGLNAKADVEAQKIVSAPTYSGTLDVPAFNLRQLLASLNKPAPKTADPNVLTRLGVNTRFAGSTKSLQLDNLKVSLDDTQLAGNIDIADFTGPAVNFGLKIDRIDADRYLEPTPPGKNKPLATPEAAAAGAASEVPLRELRALKMKGDLVIGDLVLSGAKMKNVKFVIDAQGEQIKVNPLGAELYQGHYGGAIVLDARGKQPLLDLNTRLSNVHVEPLLMDTVKNNSLSGIVSFDAALKARGTGADSIKRSLNGNGRFGTQNGVFRGVDAVAILRAVEQIIECKCPVPIPKGGATRFASLGGTLLAKNGVIRNEDLVLAGDGFTIEGKGTLANLHDNTLKYDLKLGVTESRAQRGTANYNLGGYSVPIQCRGQIDDPSCLPDFGEILAQVAKSAIKKKVKDAVGKKLKDAVGGEAGDALKNLLKF